MGELCICRVKLEQKHTLFSGLFGKILRGEFATAGCFHVVTDVYIVKLLVVCQK